MQAQLEMYACAPHRELTRDRLFNPNVALIRHSWIINFFFFWIAQHKFHLKNIAWSFKYVKRVRVPFV